MYESYGDSARPPNLRAESPNLMNTTHKVRFALLRAKEKHVKSLFEFNCIAKPDIIKDRVCAASPIHFFAFDLELGPFY
jgi:hypothetical protein